jgi:hypothetical protein
LLQTGIWQQDHVVDMFMQFDLCVPGSDIWDDLILYLIEIGIDINYITPRYDGVYRCMTMKSTHRKTLAFMELNLNSTSFLDYLLDHDLVTLARAYIRMSGGLENFDVRIIEKHQCGEYWFIPQPIKFLDRIVVG